MIEKIINKRSDFSVSIGIAAYNAEKNITFLVDGLLRQIKRNYRLRNIFIYSDASTDKTLELLYKYKNKKIKIINSTKRNGFGNVVKSLLRKNTADLFILLNDDISINNRYFIEKIVNIFYNENNIGLACGNPQPLRPTNLVERGVISGFRAFEKVKIKVKSGNSVLTCDGKTMIFTKKFIQALEFPKDLKKIGNVDGFMYFSCINIGFKYRFVKDAIVKFKCPSTVADFVKWTTRNNLSREILKKKFGSKVSEEYVAPIIPFTYYRIIEFLKNPIGSLLIFILNIYCAIQAKYFKKNFSLTWDLVKTTKDLNLNKIH